MLRVLQHIGEGQHGHIHTFEREGERERKRRGKGYTAANLRHHASHLQTNTTNGDEIGHYCCRMALCDRGEGGWRERPLFSSLNKKRYPRGRCIGSGNLYDRPTEYHFYIFYFLQSRPTPCCGDMQASPSLVKKQQQTSPGLNWTKRPRATWLKFTRPLP